DTDDPTPGGEEFDIRAEHLDRPEAAVQEDEGRAFTEELIPELDSIDARKLGVVRRHRHILLVVARALSGSQKAILTALKASRASISPRVLSRTQSRRPARSSWP